MQSVEIIRPTQRQHQYMKRLNHRATEAFLHPFFWVCTKLLAYCSPIYHLIQSLSSPGTQILNYSYIRTGFMHGGEQYTISGTRGPGGTWFRKQVHYKYRAYLWHSIYKMASGFIRLYGWDEIVIAQDSEKLWFAPAWGERKANIPGSKHH